jgi:hypothetical protein
MAGGAPLYRMSELFVIVAETAIDHCDVLAGQLPYAGWPILFSVV